MVRRFLQPSLLALAACAALAACGGGGGSGSSGGGGGGFVPTPTPTPTLPPASTSSVTVSNSAITTLSLPTISSGVSVAIQVPPANGTSGSVSGTLTSSQPAGVATPAAVKRMPAAINAASGQVNPVAYVSITSATQQAFKTTPASTFTVPATITAPNNFWLAEFDSSNPGGGWTVVAGPVARSGNTITFASTSNAFTMTPNVTYTFVLFAPGGTYPTPSPTPVATATAIAAGTPCITDAERVAQAKRNARTANGAVVPNRLYVTYTGGTRLTQSLGRSVSADRAIDMGDGNGVAHAAITLPDGANRAAAIATLRANPNVIDVADVHRRLPSIACSNVANDPRFENDHQWYLFRQNVPGAWLLSHGAGIKVAVLDSGVDETNADIGPKIIWKERVLKSKVTTGTGSVQDHDGHGTNVAGLVAATTNNGYGVASVGWDVQLLIFEIFDDPTAANAYSIGADTTDEAIAINDAVAKGADVISLSLGSPQSAGPPDPAELNAINAAINAGVVVVAAAGNEYTSGGTVPDYPGGYPGVVAVGASATQDATPNVYSTITDTVASYSNSGPTLIAPGGDEPTPDATPIDYLHWIYGYVSSTVSDPTFQCSAVKGGTYPASPCVALYNGTSQATPQVSGAVALLLANHGGPRKLTPAQVMTRLKNASTPLTGVPAARQGAGLLNVQSLVAAP